MKALSYKMVAVLIGEIVLTGCGGAFQEVDICTCLTSPGNSEYMLKNAEACDAAISKKIGVADWKKVNFSQNPVLDAKWEAMGRECGL
jgi:hypothetical protein